MKNPSAYVKMKVLGAIDLAEGSSIRDKIRAVSEKSFQDEEGNLYRFTWRTIETWRVRYNKHGFTVCTRKNRSDKDNFRKIEAEIVLEAVEQAKTRLRPGFKISELYRQCIELGLLQRERIAPNTFRRMVRKYAMLKPDSQVENNPRLAFSKRFANEAWQVDTLYGPWVKTAQGKACQSKLIAFIDDASRVCCHGQFFYQEDLPTLKQTLRLALYKRGIPERIYADNGSIYVSADLSAICQRLGILLCHTQVRDAAAKGKIERFFRTVRDNFLGRELDLSSLEILNRQFLQWAEEEYNNRVHSTLGMKPLDRYALDRARIQYLSPNQNTDQLFYTQEERTVLTDNTFRFEGCRWECPRRCPNRKITIRYDSDKPRKQRTPFVYHDRQYLGPAQRVDFVGNDRLPNPPKAPVNEPDTSDPTANPTQP